MKITIFESESIFGTSLSRKVLEELGRVQFFGKVPQDEVAACVGDSEAVLCSKIRFTPEIMDACKHLRYIGLMATGYNNIDLAAAKERGIVVTNIPDYSAAAVSQHTIALILQFATSLIRYHNSTQNGDWTRSPIFCYFPYEMCELQGKTLGLLGLGSIGKRVAKIAEALGMRVIYHARSAKEVPYEKVPLERLFAESDFLSLHCPLTEETEKIVNETSLSLMKRSAFLINTARGGLIDEAALAKALKEDRLAGFGADVLTEEPQSKTCPLIGVKNCVLTPHVAWAPPETRKRLISILTENFLAFERGEPQNVVNS